MALFISVAKTCLTFYFSHVYKLSHVHFPTKNNNYHGYNNILRHIYACYNNIF